MPGSTGRPTPDPLDEDEQPIRVFLVDDHSIVRTGLIAYLASRSSARPQTAARRSPGWPCSRRVPARRTSS